MRLLDRAKFYFLPAPANSYRPKALQKHTVALFLAFTLVSEGFFVSSMFNANPAQLFLSAAAAAPVPADMGGVPGFFARATHAIAVAASQPGTLTLLILGAVSVLLLSIVAVALYHTTHLQSHDLVLPALVVVGIALLLLILNLWYGGAYVT